MNSFWNGKRRFVALLMFLSGVFVALRVPPVIPFIQLPARSSRKDLIFRSSTSG